MNKVIGKFEEIDGVERESFDALVIELGLVGSLSDDVGDIQLFYDDKGNTYAIAMNNSEDYYGTKQKEE